MAAHPKPPTSSFGSLCEEVACFYPGRHGDEHRHTHAVAHRVASSYIRVSRGTRWLPSHHMRNCFQHPNSWKYGPRKSVLPAVFTVSRDEKVAAKGKEDLSLNSVSPANHWHPFFALFSLPGELRGSSSTGLNAALGKICRQQQLKGNARCTSSEGCASERICEDSTQGYVYFSRPQLRAGKCSWMATRRVGGMRDSGWRFAGEASATHFKL